MDINTTSRERMSKHRQAGSRKSDNKIFIDDAHISTIQVESRDFWLSSEELEGAALEGEPTARKGGHRLRN